MTDNILFPSLSAHGWTDSSAITGDMLMAHFFVAEESQTYLYTGHISSWPGIVQATQGDYSKYASKLKTDLDYYFSRYFNNVVIETAVIQDPVNTDKEVITLYVEYTDNAGVTQQLSKLVTLINMKFTSLTNINNGD